MKPFTEDSLASLEKALPSIAHADVQALIGEVRELRASADIVRSLVRESADRITEEIASVLPGCEYCGTTHDNPEWCPDYKPPRPEPATIIDQADNLTPEDWERMRKLAPPRPEPSPCGCHYDTDGPFVSCGKPYPRPERAERAEADLAAARAERDAAREALEKIAGTPALWLPSLSQWEHVCIARAALAEGGKTP